MPDEAPSPSAAMPIGRKPLQGRSKASLERMQATARELMLERGSEDFTLQEVSNRGQVSIGSIYLRFEGKDALVRAVLVQAMQDLRDAEDAMLDALVRNCGNLAEFVESYIADYAEVLRLHAPLLRLAMLRAEQDGQISGLGKQAADDAVAASTRAFLEFRAEIGGTDAALRAQSVYQIVFATLARRLSLGSTNESSPTADWHILKGELAHMCIAYLRSA
ncbi:TetR/AcrR family transcriptional regulator [Novosphingobium sp. KACC 22771]|uniref:TetR/AcrR family transcriptional regulator n=1 Tax=Novosphingobium sp. KACC 22771 TaxID=3025670 RepID=UPI0023650093|nr:TetR/AcrR family transcriptional regulator [Novosphingobium sp. KACC 22771]WDF74760.1 TetR/AcrR family transcriptional regulator [Novosphingobium sp. KACC 22771]